MIFFAGFGRVNGTEAFFVTAFGGGAGTGVFFAIGWSGQWEMTLLTRQQETPDAAASFRFTGGMPGVSTVLYPGEKIRTARILLMPWDGEIDDAFNLSRRFLLKYHTPHVDGKPAVLPFSLLSWGHDEQRGKAEIDALVRSGLPLDTYWTDAGWYGPAGSHCDDKLCNDWSDYVGWYSHDPLRYPGGEGAVVEFVQAAQGVEQAGLAAAGGAENAHKAGVRQGEADILQHMVGVAAAAVIGFVQFFRADHTATSSSSRMSSCFFTSG